MKTTRVAARKDINNILRETTKGLFSDEYWEPVNNAWNVLSKEGYKVVITGSRYTEDSKGNPDSKIWTFEIEFHNKKPFYGVLTAHGAGTVNEPLSKYDISAYVS